MTPPHRSSIGPNSVVRILLKVFALFSLGYWGYLAWPFPLPAVLFMIGVPLFAAVLWRLFRSPKAVFPLDAIGRAIIEIFVMGAAVATWFMLSSPGIGSVFAAIAVLSGVINARAENRREAHS